MSGLPAWRSTNSKARSNLKQRYGLTIQQLEILWKQSKGLCAICSQPNPVCIDHDHNTKKVRGLLCKKCNTGIGMLRDDRLMLARALAYLVKHSDKPERPARHRGRRTSGDKPLPKNDPRRPKS